MNRLFFASLFKWISFYRRVHYTVNWFCTFSNDYPLCSSLPRVSEICVMKSRVRVYFACVCVSVLNFIYATFYPLIFYAKFLLACSTCLLCTTLFLTSCFSIIVYDLLFVLTKPNWTFLLYYFFCFHQVRRLLLLLSCFPLFSAACIADVTDWERECLCVCIGELACLLWCAEGVLACVWVRLLK